MSFLQIAGHHLHQLNFPIKVKEKILKIHNKSLVKHIKTLFLGIMRISAKLTTPMKSGSFLYGFYYNR
jgi:hypothetical protein